MSLFTINWEMWTRGAVSIEAATEDEAIERFNEEYVGCLEPYDQGLDIIEIRQEEPGGARESDAVSIDQEEAS